MIKDYFSKLTYLQAIEYILLIALAFIIPISWQLASKLTAILALMIPIRIIAERKNRNSITGSNKKLFLLFTITYLLYGISMLYTSNVAEGWQNMEKKLSFIIFPLFFFLSDLNYLSSKHTKAIFYSFVAGLLSFIVSNLIWGLYDYIMSDAPIQRLLGREITKIHPIHHSYMAMYCCFGIIYCFVELFDRKRKLAKCTVFLITTIVFSTLFVILVESRAGILCMILLYAFLFAWLFFAKKQRRTAIATGSSLIALVVTFFILFPSGWQRIIQTQQTLTSSTDKEDIRITLLRAGSTVAMENLPTGVGIGDRNDALIAYYQENNLPCGDLNSHNQFIDTTISIGILGLLSLLSYFVVPIILCIKNRHRNFVFILFLFMIAFNSVFEAVFESQTGILFFNFIFCMLFYTSFIQKQDNQYSKHKS